jgi:predicted short-subunit dehydrogenase-like oxidoreductase (DUF2520 family)
VLNDIVGSGWYSKETIPDICTTHIYRAGDFMRIGFIGAGKVGFTLGRYLVDKMNSSEVTLDINHISDEGDGGVYNYRIEVSGYYSNSYDSASDAAAFTDTTAYRSLADIIMDSDVLMLTVPDGVIETVWQDIKSFNIKDKIICHCSGAMTSKIFSGVTEAGAFGYSIHPMYAISSKTESYKEIHNSLFTVEGDERWLASIRNFIAALGNECVIITSENKTMYHAAAVYGSNLVVGLYDTALKLLEKCGFNEEQAEKAISPLFIGNAEKLVKAGPVDSLTGPIERNDVSTVMKHLNVLQGNDKDIYVSLSKAVTDVAARKHSDRDYNEIMKLLL